MFLGIEPWSFDYLSRTNLNSSMELCLVLLIICFWCEFVVTSSSSPRSWTLFQSQFMLIFFFVDSTQAIWLDLQERFQWKNTLRNFQLKRSLATLAQNQDSVSIYFIEFKSLIDELNSLYLWYVSLYMQLRNDCFLTNSVWWIFYWNLISLSSHARAQLLLMDLISSVTRDFSLHQEEQRSIGSFLLFHRFSPSPRKNTCSNKQKHYPVCSHCGILGHSIGWCCKVHGYKSKQKWFFKYHSSKSYDEHCKWSSSVPRTILNQIQSQLSDSASQSGSFSSTSHIAGINPSTSWIVDSGDSAHICCYKELLLFQRVVYFHDFLQSIYHFTIMLPLFVSPLH